MSVLNVLTIFTFLISGQLAFACEISDQVTGEYLVRVTPQTSVLNLQKTITSVPDLLKNSRCINCNGFDSSKKKENFLDSQLTVQQKTIEASPRSTLYIAQLNLTELEELKSNPSILSIEPNCRIQIAASEVIPNDTLYSQQWALQSIRASQGWSVTQGSRNIVVAVSDTGVDYTHPDLQNQMWRNETEINGSSAIDDDGNGCVDDFYGCDVADADGDPKPGNAFASGHGTHVAGIIGASGNNAIGISGIAWNVRIMAVKGFYDTEASTTLSALIESIYYAIDNGADIVNCSWGSKALPTSAEADAFSYAEARGVVMVVAAGNSAVDASEFSPAAIESAVTVGSYNSLGHLSSFSNFGNRVDILAPGGDAASSGGYEETIMSTLPVAQGAYGGIQGTSMAAPHVAGTLALLLSINPRLTANDLRSILKNSSPFVAFAKEANTSIVKSYSKLDVIDSIEFTYRLTNCTGEVCSLSGGFGGGPSGLSSALAFGMGGCNADSATNDASLFQTLLLFLILAVPISLPMLGRFIIR